MLSIWAKERGGWFVSHTRPELKLETLIDEARRLKLKGFLQRYPNPALVAMGVLKVEEIRARVGSTMQVSVARPARHNPKEKHPLAGRVFFIPRTERAAGELVVGREAPADVLVPDKSVSSRHCVVRWDSEEVSITDVGSTNGTLVNLKTQRTHITGELLNEDIITVGRHSFQYFLPAPFYHALITLSSPSP